MGLSLSRGSRISVLCFPCIYVCVHKKKTKGLYSTGIFQKCLCSFNISKTVLTTMCNLLIPNSRHDLSLTQTMYMCLLYIAVVLYPSLFANKHQITLLQPTRGDFIKSLLKLAKRGGEPTYWFWFYFYIYKCMHTHT